MLQPAEPFQHIPPGLQPPVFVENPPCPYVGEIPGGLQNGTTIAVQGTTPQHEDGFSVNLTVSSRMEPVSDTALHVNPRFNEDCLVLNSLIFDSWGSEVRPGNLPFKKGQPFEILILVASNEFKIALNGKHFAVFGHRMPKENIRYLIIKGGIMMNFIRITGSYVPPPLPSPSGYPVIYNPSIPAIVAIPGGVYPQRTIQISGFPKAFNPSGFTVNLKTAGEIALHFDVRFSFGSTHNVVVRNALIDGEWGSEEVHQGSFPFQPGVGFDMVIRVESYCFMVAVNSQHFTAFNHRLMPLSRVNTLEITGDVQVNMITF